MNRPQLIATLLTSITCFTTSAIGGPPETPKPGSETKIFQADLGTWNVEIKAWDGPGKPNLSKGKETNRMLGDHWMITDFEGNMMGLDFTGHGVYGYDNDKKKYVGTWIDSLGPTKMELVGTYDKTNHTLKYEGIGPAPDGSAAKHVMTTKYRDDGARVMSMEMEAGGQMIKVFEMHYTKAKEH